MLALTVGLLIFLMVDATAEGLEAAETIPRSYQPTVLFAFAAGASYSRWPGSAGGSAVGEQAVANRRAQGGFWHSSWRSESVCTTSARDCAIAAAFALGEAALGSLLIIGFTAQHD